MKTRIIAFIAFLAISTGVHAQFTNTPPVSSSPQKNLDSEGWTTFWLEYNPLKFKYDISGIDDDDASGFSAGFSHAYCISPGTPVFFEPGIGVQLTKHSDSEDRYKNSFTMISAKVPLNFLYNISIPNSNFSIIPFAGATLRYNIYGRNKEEFGKESDEYNVFDDKDMDGEAWKRFQIGWQLGLKARLGKTLIAGISYGNDFSEIVKKTKIQTTTITLGFAF